MKYRKLKRIVCVILILISAIGIGSAIYEYRGGYEEIPATVTRTYMSSPSRYQIKRLKYNLEWIDKDGEIVQQGNLYNKYGYSEGDEIIIKVDAYTHHTLYKNYIPLIVMFSVVLGISSIILVVSFKKKV